MMTETKELMAALSGARVSAAFSSLTTFSCEFDNGKGIVMEAISSPTGPRAKLSVLDSQELPRDADAVCKVDWQWIYGSEVADATISDAVARFFLKPAGPLTVSVQVWQGKPFLAFQPFRAPA